MIPTLLVFPVTEEEIENVVCKLRGKSLTGFGEIPECLVMKYIQYISKPVVHIFIASLKLGIFPDTMKIAKVRLLHEKRR